MTDQLAVDEPLAGRLALSAAEVAGALGISVRSVWRMASTGEIPPAVKIGRCARWRCASLEAWLQKEERRARRHLPTN